MNKINELVSHSVTEAIYRLYKTEVIAADVKIQPTSDKHEGEITVLAFPFIKVSGKSPFDTAKEIAAAISEDIGAQCQAVQGFINISMGDEHWAKFIVDVHLDKSYGLAEPGSMGEVVLEYSSPNTNKPLHVGHMRNNFLGFSIAEILKAVGHTVHRVQIVNDRGIHICKSMVAWKMFGDGHTPDWDAGTKGDHFVGDLYVRFENEMKRQAAELELEEDDTDMMKSARQMLLAWEDGDERTMWLWRRMNSWVYSGFAETYDRMGVAFDRLYYESETYTRGKAEVLEGLEDKKFYVSEEGAVLIELPNSDHPHTLLRADGTSMYITQDIGTAIIRSLEYPEALYHAYVVGSEQKHHFEVLFAVLQRLGVTNSEAFRHISYGMIQLCGERMSSRDGNVVHADFLMDTMDSIAATLSSDRLNDMSLDGRQRTHHAIGIGALKYFFLKYDPSTPINFDPEKSVSFEGETGTFIQYAAVRVKSLLKKAGDFSSSPIEGAVLTIEDMAVIRKVSEWPDVLKLAAAQHNPSVVCRYLYELARAYNGMYHERQVIGEQHEPTRLVRLAECSAVSAILTKGLAILGIQVPEKM